MLCALRSQAHLRTSLPAKVPRAMLQREVSCAACAEIKRIEEEERKKQIEAVKQARKAAKEEAKLHREAEKEFFRKYLDRNDASFSEAARIVHRNQQSAHNNPIEVVAVEQVYNARLKMQFFECKQDLIDPTAEPLFKFHGTSKEAVDGICKDGFRQPTAEKPNMDEVGGTKPDVWPRYLRRL